MKNACKDTKWIRLLNSTKLNIVRQPKKAQKLLIKRRDEERREHTRPHANELHL